MIWKFLLIVLVSAVPAFAQNAQIASVVHTQHKINSTILGEERTILVRVPTAYRQPESRFPVIYMLDAHAPQNAMVAAIVEQQAWGGMMPEMIVVGIQNTNRTRDLSPSKTERPDTGGGDKFLDFIEKEVMPLVEKNYRTEPYRVFAGHSLGGLAAIYAFSSRPDMFDAYIAASPVLHWDRDFVIKRSEEAFKRRSDLKKTVYIGVGNEPDYMNGFNSYKDLLKRSNLKNFEYEFQQFPADTHGSVVMPVYYAGLRKVFSGWTPPATGNIVDIENHYRRLSDRFGYRIPPPENLLNQAGYQLLTANRLAEAIEVFKRNVQLYPNSANCLDSLAEAYEKNGQTKTAKEAYEKAYKMAEVRGETELARTAKASFDRISKL